jgi:hypothetical protein
MTDEELADAASAAVWEIGRQFGAEIVPGAPILRGCWRLLRGCGWRTRSS